MGETTVAIAAAHPQNNYIGIEVHTPGVGSLLKQTAALELTNLRVIQHDAVAVVSDMLMPESLDGLHIFFPDPWPKKRQQKRRLIQLHWQPLASKLALTCTPPLTGLNTPNKFSKCSVRSPA
jgi:tRNA (guanine-N7-)-methyltransferase